MSECIHKSRNVMVLLYDVDLPEKYRRAVFGEQVNEVLKEGCLEIEPCDQVKFLEIGTHRDHVHFLAQSVLTYSVTRIVMMLKRLTAREVWQCSHVKKALWSGEFWSDGRSMGTSRAQQANRQMMGRYIKNQGIRAFSA